LKNDGTLLGTVPFPGQPAGMAIDKSGKIWVCSYGNSDVRRIDPSLNGGVGGVDLTIQLTPGAAPYAFSGMMGNTLTTGTWTITHDSTVPGETWGNVTWNALTPSDSTLTVQARSSIDGITYSAWQPVTKLVDLMVPDGRYLQVRVTFQRATTTAGETPILYDISIGATV